MSRGGSGEFRGRGGKSRIPGQDPSSASEENTSDGAAAPQWFPAIDLPKARPATASERQQVLSYKQLRNRIHKGPLYTVLPKDLKTGESRKPREARVNAFDAMPSHRNRYKAATRELPKFPRRQYAIHFFPEELVSVLNPREKPGPGSSQRIRTRRLEQLDRGREEADGEQEGNVEDTGERAEAEEDEEMDERSENPDETFEDEESELGEDYNAEAYFDGGDEDADEVPAGDGDFDNDF